MPKQARPNIESASTLAVIVASHEPLLFLSDDLRVIAASASFCKTFQIDPGMVHGRLISELGDGEWAHAQLTSLLKATASGIADIAAYEMDLVRKDERTLNLVLNAHILDDGDRARVRILLAITNVTEARATDRQKDDLIREKAILMQEVQHRVANSLQIIASVLMQSARRVQSDEVRGHLRDAHDRVMSIAAVQRHLSVSQVGDVALRPYFVQLCESLGASMIRDRGQLSIEVNVDDSSVNSHRSVSLGLIVTELIINALKHAFPDQRTGKIVIDYHSSGLDWTLSVTDDGVGMPTGEDTPKAGLGTGIVHALTTNLEGEIEVTDAKPGTAISIVHTEAAHTGRNLPAAA